MKKKVMGNFPGSSISHRAYGMRRQPGNSRYTAGSAIYNGCWDNERNRE